MKLNKVIIIVMLYIFLGGCSQPEAIYKEVARGKIKQVEFKQGSWNSHDRTFIYFESGSIFWLPYIHDIPAENIIIFQLKKGTGKLDSLRWKIIKDPNGTN